MKFYLKCTHIGKLRRGWFVPTHYELQLVSIAIACETNVNYFEVSNGFDKEAIDPYALALLPTERVWKPLTQIKDEVLHFLETQSCGLPVEFYGYEGSADFVTLSTLFGGVNNHNYPSILPTTIINLSQSYRDFVEILDESHFGPESEFPTVMPGNSTDQKLRMFVSHPDCPEPIVEANYSALRAALWIKKMDSFLCDMKEDFIAKIELPEIENINTGDEQ